MIRLIDILCASIGAAFAIALALLAALGALALLATGAAGVVAFALAGLLLAAMFFACLGGISIGLSGFVACFGVMRGTLDLDRLT